MNYVIPQSKLNKIVARWINTKVDNVRDLTSAIGEPIYMVKTKNGKPFMYILLQKKDVEGVSAVRVSFDEMLYDVYRFIPKNIELNSVMEALFEYIRNPSLRSFEMKEIDPYMNNRTEFYAKLLPFSWDEFVANYNQNQ
jgi:hypothetical protein